MTELTQSEAPVSIRTKGFKLGLHARPLNDKTIRKEAGGNIQEESQELKNLRSGYIEGILTLLEQAKISPEEFGVSKSFEHIFSEKSGRRGVINGLEHTKPQIPEVQLKDKKNNLEAHYWDGYAIGWAAKVIKAEGRKPYAVPRSVEDYDFLKKICSGDFSEISYQRDKDLNGRISELLSKGKIRTPEEQQEYISYIHKEGLMREGLFEWLRGKRIKVNHDMLDIIIEMNPQARQIIASVINGKRVEQSMLGPEETTKALAFANRLKSKASPYPNGSGK